MYENGAAQKSSVGVGVFPSHPRTEETSRPQLHGIDHLFVCARAALPGRQAAGSRAQQAGHHRCAADSEEADTGPHSGTADY
jgi:hypothetical protein